jgi:hypothetical protein
VATDYRARVLADAARLGVPCVLQVGRITAVCTAVRWNVDGSHEGDFAAHEWPSAGAARQFVSRAVHEKGWRCAQRVDPPSVYPSPGGAA